MTLTQIINEEFSLIDSCDSIQVNFTPHGLVIDFNNEVNGEILDATRHLYTYQGDLVGGEIVEPNAPWEMSPSHWAWSMALGV